VPSQQWSLRDKCVVAGVGTVGYFRHSNDTEASLAAQAVLKAADDAGIPVKEIDGIITYTYNNDSVRPQEIAQALGLPHLRLWLENYLGGTAGAAFMAIAVMAIAAGMARHVVIYRSAKHRSGRVRIGGSGQSADTGGLEQFLVPQGWSNFFTSIAPEVVRHMYEFGTTEEQLGAVALNAYANAALNDRAVGKGWGPKTLDGYLESPYLAYPLRRWDFASEVDGACAYLITSAERARDLRAKPVYITALAQSATPDPMHVGRFAHFDHLGTNSVQGAAAYYADELFGMAGVARSDIDVAALYDMASFEVIKQVEDFGFCKKGEGGPFVASGAITRTGSLPVSSGGGLLAEGYAHGTNLVIEAVEQLRGTAGPRQIANARIALWTRGSGGPLGGGGILTTR
jgi:acetyl-CoA acetyltransferase